MSFAYGLGVNARGKAIRAHSVQNQCVLDVLCENGKVIMPKLNVTFETLPKIEFRNIGRRQATTFTGLCAKHDHAIFKPIEANPVNISNSEHLFLLAYRAALKEAHASRKSAFDLQLNYQVGVEKGLFPEDEPSPPGMLAVEQMMAAYFVDGVKAEMDVAFLNRRWERAFHVVTELGSAPTIAVNSMFSTNSYSEETIGPAFVMLNIFPRNGNTTVIFSCLEEHRAQVESAYGTVLSASGEYKKYLLSKLVLSKCENLAMSPVFYESLPEQQKEAIADFYIRNSCGHVYEIDDPKLFLFAPVPQNA